jgi:hypothetical protein
MNGCVCPGDILTYECTVMRAVATVWTGSALDGHEIVLLHSDDEFHNKSLYRNNGATVARSLPIEGNNYTSRLKVTITPDTAGETSVECLYDDGLTATLVFTSVIPTTGLLSHIASKD